MFVRSLWCVCVCVDEGGKIGYGIAQMIQQINGCLLLNVSVTISFFPVLFLESYKISGLMDGLLLIFKDSSKKYC